MLKLKTITEKAHGDAKYCFTTFAQVTADTVLTGPIWKRIGSDELQMLVPPLSEKS